jgi:hypothetical protein
VKLGQKQSLPKLFDDLELMRVEDRPRHPQAAIASDHRSSSAWVGLGVRDPGPSRIDRVLAQVFLESAARAHADWLTAADDRYRSWLAAALPCRKRLLTWIFLHTYPLLPRRYLSTAIARFQCQEGNTSVLIAVAAGCSVPRF